MNTINIFGTVIENYITSGNRKADRVGTPAAGR